MDTRVEQWTPVCQSIALLLGPYAEVVLHDVDTDRILQIWNPMNRRSPGDPSDLGELDSLEPAAQDVFGPYEKLLADGRRLSSVSAVLRDPAGAPSVVLCINLDRSPLEQAIALLAGFAAPTSARPEALFEQDWAERVEHIVGSYVRRHGRMLERLTREDRQAVVAELDNAGIFAVKRAIPYVASTLRISRSTLYTLLPKARKT